MTTNVLLLNADHQPIKVVPWQRAIALVLADKVRVIETYAGEVIRTVKRTFPKPAVVALKTFAKLSNSGLVRVRFKAVNVFARDDFECQYCGIKPVTPSGLPDHKALTMDHVIPRSRAVNGMVQRRKTEIPVTCWENIVTACHACNHVKADKTPFEAGMRLKRQPRKPNRFDLVRILLLKAGIPREWEGLLG